MDQLHVVSGTEGGTGAFSNASWLQNGITWGRARTLL